MARGHAGGQEKRQQLELSSHFSTNSFSRVTNSIQYSVRNAETPCPALGPRTTKRIQLQRAMSSSLSDACTPRSSRPRAARPLDPHAPEPRNLLRPDAVVPPSFPLCAPSSALIPNLACAAAQSSLFASHRLVSSLSLLASHRLVSSLSLFAPHRLDALHLALAACRLEQGRSVSGRGCTRVRRAASDVCLTKA